MRAKFRKNKRNRNLLLILITLLIAILVVIIRIFSQKQTSKLSFIQTHSYDDGDITTYNESVVQPTPVSIISATPKPLRHIQTITNTNGWMVYRDTFDSMTITFRYPQGYTIFDEDSSSPLTITDPNTANENRAELWRILPDVPYDGEPIYEWFRKHILLRDLSSINSTIGIQPVTVNGKEFILLQVKVDEKIIDYYYGIQKSMPFYMSNKGLPEDQFLAILDSFVLITPPKQLYYQKSE